MSVFHEKLLAALEGDGDKMLSEACALFGVSVTDLTSDEKVMVVLAALKRAKV